MNPKVLLIAESRQKAGDSEKALKSLACHVTGFIHMVEFNPATLAEDKPDAVIWDVISRDGSAAAARQMRRIRGCALLWSAEAGLLEACLNLEPLTGASFLPKPVKTKHWGMILNNDLEIRRREQGMAGEIPTLKNQLKERKTCARAMGILMDTLGLDEPQAEERLYKISQELRLRKPDAAQRIVESSQQAIGPEGVRS